MCGRRAMAEDVVQDAFVSLWRTSTAYDPARGSVRAWILRVVHNRAVDTFRRTEVRTSRDVPDVGITEQMPAAELTEVEVERRGDAQEVRSALEDLPVDQRRVIELAYFSGFSHSEIAAILELPAGTVKGRMRLGLTKLRTSLGEPVP
jgi:RNA polymerase sigma-70 factor (ECF subfamily)